MVGIQALTSERREISLETKVVPQPFTDGTIVGYIDAVSMDPLVSKIPVTEVELTMMPKFNVAFALDGPGRGLLVAPAIVQIANRIS
jgi:hypothetical protein